MNRRRLLKGTAALVAVPRLALAQERLRIGLTAVILADQAAFLARWADYLSQRLDARVTFASRDQYQAVHEMLNNGQVEAAWTCGYPFVRFQSQLQLVAVPLYKGQPVYSYCVMYVCVQLICSGVGGRRRGLERVRRRFPISGLGSNQQRVVEAALAVRLV